MPASYTEGEYVSFVDHLAVIETGLIIARSCRNGTAYRVQRDDRSERWVRPDEIVEVIPPPPVATLDDALALLNG